GGNGFVGAEQRRGGASGGPRRAVRQPLEAWPVEADDGLGERAVGAGVGGGRGGVGAQSGARPAGTGVGGGRWGRAEAPAEVVRRVRVVLGNGDDREAAARADRADAIEKRPRELARGAGGLEDRVERLSAGRRKRGAAVVGQGEIGEAGSGLENGHAGDYRLRRARVPSDGPVEKNR